MRWRPEENNIELLSTEKLSKAENKVLTHAAFVSESKRLQRIVRERTLELNEIN